MKIYDIESIRNIAILGQTGAGKSNFIESLEYTVGLTKRITNPTDESKMSSTTTLNSLEYQNMKYNFLDIPGYSDFSGELESGLTACAGAIIVVDATSDVSIGTENAFEVTDDRKIPKFVFVNKVDSDKADYDKIIRELKNKFGKRIAPFHVPWGKADSFKGHINVVDLFARKYNGKDCENAPMPDDIEVEEIRNMLLEAVAETSEELMDKYFAGEEFTTQEIHAGLRKGVLDGSLVPVICGSSYKNIHTTFDMIKEYMPSPLDNVKINSSVKEFTAQIFKTVIDPFLGVLSYAKVISGELKPDTEVYNINKNETERIGKIYTWVHTDLVELQKAVVGDIVVFNKLNYTKNSDTLSINPKANGLPEIKFPKEQMLVAIEPANKADDDKISNALHKLRDEDSSFYWRRDQETGQTVLGVQGEIHANTIINKLSKKYGVKVLTTELKVPYKETIKGVSDVQGKYKKQSGGHGQYGDVKIRFSHSEDEKFVFEEEIVGGVVPKSYIPAVEKGLVEALKEGVLAGYPATNIKAVLYDGSYHDVDSSEMSFKIAAAMAFKKGMEQANPVLLEPIMELRITIPEEYVGDIMGDINKKRGRVLGMESLGNKHLIVANAPMAETFKYINDLKSMTQGRGSFEMEFERYEEVPYDIAKKIIEKANSEK